MLNQVRSKYSSKSDHFVRVIHTSVEYFKKLGFSLSTNKDLITLKKDNLEIILQAEEIMDAALMLHTFDPKTTQSHVQDQKKKAYIKIVSLGKEKHVQLVFVKFDHKTIFEVNLDL